MHTKIKTVSIYDLTDIFCEKDTILITNKDIFLQYHSMFKGWNDKLIIVPNHQSSKNINSFTYLLGQLVEKKANKNSHLLAIGGGATSDLVGFVASIYLRGVKFSIVPTTLLSMVDAAIGGKNALNFEHIKNIIGTIYQPECVYIDTMFLRSLSNTEILSGFAEIIKIALLFDFQLLNDSLYYLDNIAISILNFIIMKTIKHKMRIVTDDLYDSGNRRFLNFGHTIGHALELRYGLPHGFAVAYGMVFETKIAVKLGLTDDSIYNEINRIIKKYYHHQFEMLDVNEVLENIYFDKKIYSNNIKFPVIKEIGRAELIDVNIDDIKHLYSKNFIAL